MCSVRYRYARYRYGFTKLTEVSGTGIDVVPKLPKCPVPVLMLYRTYRSVRYRYEGLYRYRRYQYPYRTELTEVSGTGIDVVPNLCIDVVPNLPKCPVPVLMYRTYRSVRYRYWCRTELTEVSGTGIDVVPNLSKCPVPVLMYRYRYQHRYRLGYIYQRHMYRAYPVFHGRIRLLGSPLFAVQKVPFGL